MTSTIVRVMSAIVKIIAHSVSICGLLILIILPVNEYSWMQEMDPGIVVDDPSSKDKIFASLLLIIICLIELIVFITSGKIAGKIIASILMVSAALVWSIKYLSV